MKKMPLLIILLMVINFLVRIPFLNDVALDDEVHTWVGVKSVIDNKLNPFIEFIAYKPPLTVWVPAFLSSVFEFSRIWGRLYMAFVSSLSLLFIYILGKQLYNRKVGLISATILFFYPLFFIQGYFLYDTNLLTLLILSTLYFYFVRNKVGYFISAGLMLLTKELAILLPIVIFVYDLLISKKLKTSARFKKSLFLLSPLIIFAIWLIFNKYYLGWFINPNYLSFKDRLSNFSLPTIVGNFYGFLINFDNLLIAICLLSTFLFGLGWGYFRRSFFIKANFLLIFIFIMNYILLHFFWFAERYLLFVYAIAILLFSDLIFIITKGVSHKIIFIVILVLTNFCFYYFYSVKAGDFSNPEKSLTLFYYKKANPLVIQYIENNIDNTVMITDWEWAGYYTMPEAGFVLKRREIIDCELVDVSCFKNVIKNMEADKNYLLILDCINNYCKDDGRLNEIKDNLKLIKIVTPRYWFFPKNQHFKVFELTQ